MKFSTSSSEKNKNQKKVKSLKCLRKTPNLEAKVSTVGVDQKRARTLNTSYDIQEIYQEFNDKLCLNRERINLVLRSNRNNTCPNEHVSYRNELKLDDESIPRQQSNVVQNKLKFEEQSRSMLIQALKKAHDYFKKGKCLRKYYLCIHNIYIYNGYLKDASSTRVHGDVLALRSIKKKYNKPYSFSIAIEPLTYNIDSQVREKASNSDKSLKCNFRNFYSSFADADPFTLLFPVFFASSPDDSAAPIGGFCTLRCSLLIFYLHFEAINMLSYVACYISNLTENKSDSDYTSTLEIKEITQPKPVNNVDAVLGISKLINVMRGYEQESILFAPANKRPNYGFDDASNGSLTYEIADAGIFPMPGKKHSIIQWIILKKTRTVVHVHDLYCYDDDVAHDEGSDIEAQVVSFHLCVNWFMKSAAFIDDVKNTNYNNINNIAHSNTENVFLKNVIPITTDSEAEKTNTAVMNIAKAAKLNERVYSSLHGGTYGLNGYNTIIIGSYPPPPRLTTVSVYVASGKNSVLSDNGSCSNSDKKSCSDGPIVGSVSVHAETSEAADAAYPIVTKALKAAIKTELQNSSCTKFSVPKFPITITGHGAGAALAVILTMMINSEATLTEYNMHKKTERQSTEQSVKTNTVLQITAVVVTGCPQVFPSISDKTIAMLAMGINVVDTSCSNPSSLPQSFNCQEAEKSVTFEKGISSQEHLLPEEFLDSGEVLEIIRGDTILSHMALKEDPLIHQPTSYNGGSGGINYSVITLRNDLALCGTLQDNVLFDYSLITQHDTDLDGDGARALMLEYQKKQKRLVAKEQPGTFFHSELHSDTLEKTSIDEEFEGIEKFYTSPVKTEDQCVMSGVEEEYKTALLNSIDCSRELKDIINVDVSLKIEKNPYNYTTYDLIWKLVEGSNKQKYLKNSLSNSHPSRNRVNDVTYYDDNRLFLEIFTDNLISNESVEYNKEENKEYYEGMKEEQIQDYFTQVEQGFIENCDEEVPSTVQFLANNIMSSREKVEVPDKGFLSGKLLQNMQSEEKVSSVQGQQEDKENSSAIVTVDDSIPLISSSSLESWKYHNISAYQLAFLFSALAFCGTVEKCLTLSEETKSIECYNSKSNMVLNVPFLELANDRINDIIHFPHNIEINNSVKLDISKLPFCTLKMILSTLASECVISMERASAVSSRNPFLAESINTPFGAILAGSEPEREKVFNIVSISCSKGNSQGSDIGATTKRQLSKCLIKGQKGKRRNILNFSARPLSQRVGFFGFDIPVDSSFFTLQNGYQVDNNKLYAGYSYDNIYNMNHGFTPAMTRAILSLLPPPPTVIHILERTNRSSAKHLSGITGNLGSRTLGKMIERSFVYNPSCISCASLLYLFTKLVTANNRGNLNTSISCHSIKNLGRRNSQKHNKKSSKDNLSNSFFYDEYLDSQVTDEELLLPPLSLAAIVETFPEPPSSIVVARSSQGTIDYNFPFINSRILLEWLWDQFCCFSSNCYKHGTGKLKFGPRLVFQLLLLPFVGMHWSCLTISRKKIQRSPSNCFLQNESEDKCLRISSRKHDCSQYHTFRLGTFTNIDISSSKIHTSVNDPYLYYRYFLNYGCGYGKVWFTVLTIYFSIIRAGASLLQAMIRLIVEIKSFFETFRSALVVASSCCNETEIKQIDLKKQIKNNLTMINLYCTLITKIWSRIKIKNDYLRSYRSKDSVYSDGDQKLTIRTTAGVAIVVPKGTVGSGVSLLNVMFDESDGCIPVPFFIDHAVYFLGIREFSDTIACSICELITTVKRESARLKRLLCPDLAVNILSVPVHTAINSIRSLFFRLGEILFTNKLKSSWENYSINEVILHVISVVNMCCTSICEMFTRSRVVWPHGGLSYPKAVKGLSVIMRECHIGELHVDYPHVELEIGTENEIEETLAVNLRAQRCLFYLPHLCRITKQIFLPNSRNMLQEFVKDVEENVVLTKEAEDALADLFNFNARLFRPSPFEGLEKLVNSEINSNKDMLNFRNVRNFLQYSVDGSTRDQLELCFSRRCLYTLFHPLPIKLGNVLPFGGESCDFDNSQEGHSNDDRDLSKAVSAKKLFPRWHGEEPLDDIINLGYALIESYVACYSHNKNRKTEQRLMKYSGELTLNGFILFIKIIISVYTPILSGSPEQETCKGGGEALIQGLLYSHGYNPYSLVREPGIVRDSDVVKFENCRVSQRKTKGYRGSEKKTASLLGEYRSFYALGMLTGPSLNTIPRTLLPLHWKFGCCTCVCYYPNTRGEYDGRLNFGNNASKTAIRGNIEASESEKLILSDHTKKLLNKKKTIILDFSEIEEKQIFEFIERDIVQQYSQDN